MDENSTYYHASTISDPKPNIRPPNDPYDGTSVGEAPVSFSLDDLTVPVRVHWSYDYLMLHFITTSNSLRTKGRQYLLPSLRLHRILISLVFTRQNYAR